MEREPQVTCNQCGCRIPGESGDGLCPACLLTLAVEFGEEDLAENLPTDEISLPTQLGDYELQEELGRGGMGRVYLAEDMANGRQVALKMLDRRMESHELRQRFFREGRLAASINHPNSLYLYGSEEIDGYPVITMEVAPSGTLQDRLNSQGKLSMQPAVDAILDIINGLEAASKAGILHRDIKPSNCFLGADGLVKVGDYGLSVSGNSPDDAFSADREKVGGTPAYASPELLKAETVDHRSDIYSVGATLFHLLTGEPPFSGRDMEEVVSNALTSDPKSLRDLCPDAPVELQQILQRCLDKRVKRRYQNYQSLRNALLKFSSRAMEPATILQRLSAGWIDYLIAFFPAYAFLMILVGGDALVVRPLVDPSLQTGRYYLLLVSIGILYFTYFEGTRGAGLGKYLKGLVVTDLDGQNRPGMLRAFVRSLIAIGCVELTRLPLLFLLVTEETWSPANTAVFVLITIFSGALPPVLSLRAKNGTTPWDKLSRTRTYQRPEGHQRSFLKMHESIEPSGSKTEIGPFQVVEELEPDKWLGGWDPVLRRNVWLFKSTYSQLSSLRRKLARPARLRWLQQVEQDGCIWEAFSVPPGLSLRIVLQDPHARQWSCIRNVLNDLVGELENAESDGTLPEQLSLDHVWISEDWRIKLLDTPYPSKSRSRKEHSSGTLEGKLEFLAEILSYLDYKLLPLHARSLIQTIQRQDVGEIDHLRRNLKAVLGKPAAVNRPLRFVAELMLPGYIWLSVIVGHYHDKPLAYLASTIHLLSLICLASYALLQLIILLGFRTSTGHSLFGLNYVLNDEQEINIGSLLIKYAITWGSLFIPVGIVNILASGATANIGTLVCIGAWLAAVCATLFQIPCNWLDSFTKVYVVRD